MIERNFGRRSSPTGIKTYTIAIPEIIPCLRDDLNLRSWNVDWGFRGLTPRDSLHKALISVPSEIIVAGVLDDDQLELASRED